MKARQLPPFRVVVKKPIAVTVCVSCKVFRPDCEVPHDDGTLPMCWVCAHHFVDHQVELHRCVGAECECLPEAIYPEAVIAGRRERAATATN